MTSTRLDIQSDPADEIIGATSIVEQIPLLTRDKKLLKFENDPVGVALDDLRKYKRGAAGGAAPIKTE